MIAAVPPRCQDSTTLARPVGYAMTRSMKQILFAALLVSGVGFAPIPLAGQTANAAALEQMARSMSPDEVVRRLEASGLSRAQVRDRLRRAGYDPALADRYFDAMESGESLEGVEPTEGVVEALRGIGVTLRTPLDTGASGADGADARAGGRPALDTLGVGFAEERDTIPRVFGRDVFRQVTSSFDPILTGPVGPNYVLGPGDEILLVLTGDVELAYTLNVTREGTIVIPDVGQISVNGLTLGQLEDRLYDRLARVYSGVRRTGDATTFFDVSLGRLRTNQIRVVGEAVRPGSYQVSSVATILEALYMAGGPSDMGSFRRIRLQRPGDPPREIDLYPYLTSGEIRDDVRLEEGDVVFIPAVGNQVTVRGMVRRQAIFEILEGEGLPALVRYAGGLLPDARRDRVQVDRILPPPDRTAGVDRILLDAPLGDVLAGVESFPVRAGDQVHVFPVLERQRQRVEILGAVWRPGQYELRPGTTVASLVDRAGGLTEDALAAEILLRRLDPSTGARTADRLTLEAGAQGPLLREFDEITVFAYDSLTVPDSVAIYGLVRNPGRYPLATGLTAGDLVLLAGGFQRGALPWSAEVVRREREVDRGGSLAVSTTVALRPGLPYPEPEIREQRPDSTNLLAVEDALPLMEGDEVFIRRIPGYVSPRRVTVEGEVESPGPYQLTRQDERLSSVLARAGGLTEAAYPDGVRLIRDGVLVGVDYEEVVGNPGGLDDPVLADGDRIVAPVVDNTVLIRGAVVFEARAVYREGMDLNDFVDQAGGYTPDADKGRVSVEYANGSRATVGKVLGLFRTTPHVLPGSTIFVPEEAPQASGFDWDSALSRILAVASTVATVYIAVNR